MQFLCHCKLQSKYVVVLAYAVFSFKARDIDDDDDDHHVVGCLLFSLFLYQDVSPE